MLEKVLSFVKRNYFFIVSGLFSILAIVHYDAPERSLECGLASMFIFLGGMMDRYKLSAKEVVESQHKKAMDEIVKLKAAVAAFRKKDDEPKE